MGKKKSVALIIVFTVIIAVLIAMCVVPTFTLPFDVNGSIKEYNSVLNVMSYDSQLGGGYYSIFYPEGVISKSEYESTYEAKKAISEKSAEEYAADYTAHGALYLNNDIVENGDADADFKEDFEKMTRVICSRFDKMNLDYLSVDILDDYCIRVEVSSEITSPDNVFGVLSAGGEFTITDATRTLPYMPANRHSMDYFIKSVSVASSSGTYYVKMDFTDEGRTLFNTVTSTIAANEDDQTINFNVGETAVISFTLDEALDQSSIYISGYTDELTAKAVAVLFDSCLNEDDVLEENMNASTTRTVDVESDDMMKFVYLAFGVIILAAIIISAIKYRGMGVANIYGFLSYLIIVIMIVSLAGYMYLSASGILAILLGFILTNAANIYYYSNIKKEYEGGKRIEAAVKEAYKKSVLPLVDINVVLIIASILMITVGTAALKVFGQVLLFSLISSAASSILLSRFYLAFFMGAAKDKFKFCNFAREIDDDED